VAYDEDLADRLRELLQDERGLTEKKMFGGLAFLINGNMSVAVSGQGGLLLRVDPDETEKLASRPGARRFEMRGREMDGWLRVEQSAVRTKRDLDRWARIGVGYARTLAKK
jgi:TfoX/Sxy family transcriptional regulator of competence genes